MVTDPTLADRGIHTYILIQSNWNSTDECSQGDPCVPRNSLYGIKGGVLVILLVHTYMYFVS